jgi:hypothetical protein
LSRATGTSMLIAAITNDLRTFIRDYIGRVYLSEWNWQSKRKTQAETIIRWSRAIGVKISEQVQSLIKDWFGPTEDGEDPFDSLVGLCSMIDVIEGRRQVGRESAMDERYEGWIFSLQ